MSRAHPHPVAADWYLDIPFLLPDDDDFEPEPDDDDLGPVDPADEPAPYSRDDVDWWAFNCDHSDWAAAGDLAPSDAELLDRATYEARVEVMDRLLAEARLELMEQWYREARDARAEAWEW